MQVRDSVALVSGANRGLGRAFVTALLEAGARKVYAAARDPRSIDPAWGAVPVALDVTKPDQIARAAELAGDVTLLVNNAGVALHRSLLAPDSIEAARAELETNAFGPLRMARAFAPALARNGGGTIVNVLSVLSWLSLQPFATYSASKAAAWSITNGLRGELAAQRTHVIAVHVAFMDTDMAADITAPKIAPADVVAQTLRAIEAGDPEVIADATTTDVKRGLSTGSYLGRSAS